jgi:cytoskeleton protein RodZ
MALRKRKAEDSTPQTRSNVVDAPIVPRKQSVSDILLGRRIECGLDLPAVAKALRIREPILTAIEEGRFDQLPGPVYAVGFIRAYAAYLGLDTETIVMKFKGEAAEVARRPHLNFPLPISDSRVPTGPLVAICLLLAGLTYAGWYYLSAGDGRLAQIVPSVPDRLRNMLSPHAAEQPADGGAGAPGAAATSTPTASEVTAPVDVAQAVPDAGSPPSSPIAPPGSAPLGSAPPGSAPSNVAAATDGVPPVEIRSQAPVAAAALPVTPDLAQPAVAGEAAKPGGQSSYGVADTDSRVVLRAVSDSWIQIRDKSSNLLFTRVLKPGERYNVPNQAGLTLVAGNAGGLDIAVDGTAVPPIGEPGRVARNVSLDPDRLLGARTRAN